MLTFIVSNYFRLSRIKFYCSQIVNIGKILGAKPDTVYRIMGRLSIGFGKKYCTKFEQFLARKLCNLYKLRKSSRGGPSRDGEKKRVCYIHTLLIIVIPPCCFKVNSASFALEYLVYVLLQYQLSPTRK